MGNFWEILGNFGNWGMVCHLSWEEKTLCAHMGGAAAVASHCCLREHRNFRFFGTFDFSELYFSIVYLSNYQLGNINFDSNINVTDIILIIDYIINPYSTLTEHQIILSDINQDQETNVTDIILLLDNILE